MKNPEVENYHFKMAWHILGNCGSKGEEIIFRVLKLERAFKGK